MSGIEYIRQKCKEKGIPVRKLETELGFSNGYLNPKKLKTVPYKKAVQIADYLEIDLDRILDVPNSTYNHVSPEVADIARELYANENLMIIFNSLREASSEDVQLISDLAKRITNND